MVRVQIAPEIEFKMDIDLGEVTGNTRDYDIQQHRQKVYAEFEQRLAKAFPEGFKLHSLEFGIDTGWHEELKLPGDDSPVIT